MKWLIYGGKGFIGTRFCTILKEKKDVEIVYGTSRVDDEKEVETELLHILPDRVVCLVGRTHGPSGSPQTIDYLENHLVENVRDNLYSPLVLAILCNKYNVHLTYLGSGCIFNGYDNGGFTEEDKPNFFGSSYSVVKGFTDRIMHMFDKEVLNIRIRMPVTDDMHSRNFVVKLMNYEKICSIDNSISVLPNVLPIMIDLIENKKTGTYNLTNPGLMNHNEMLELVKEHLDKDFTWKNFSKEEQDKIIGDRSNNLLNTNKIEKEYPDILPVKEAVKQIIIGLSDRGDK